MISNNRIPIKDGSDLVHTRYHNNDCGCGECLDRIEATTDIYDHCRYCDKPATWYGLCDECNEKERSLPASYNEWIKHGGIDLEGG